jgi:hypothetical protein
VPDGCQLSWLLCALVLTVITARTDRLDAEDALAEFCTGLGAEGLRAGSVSSAIYDRLRES